MNIAQIIKLKLALKDAVNTKNSWGKNELNALIEKTVDEFLLNQKVN